jgi:hypothetical protein
VKVLKALWGGVDRWRVKICEGCGLPAPLTTEHCALCKKPFRAAAPTGYQLVALGRRYRWLVQGQETASAAMRDGTWDIADAASGRVDVTLIPVEVDGAQRAAIVDHRGRTAATYTPAVLGEDAAGVGIVRDSGNEPMLVVRSDGPTGLHVTDMKGNVLLLASASEEAAAGLDVIVTPGGSEHRRLLLGLTLAIELVRAGRLRQAA